MTSLDKIEQAPTVLAGATTTPGSHLADELTETLKLAVPIALTQIGQIAMMTTDLAFIGRLGGEAILLALGQAPTAAHLAQEYLFGLSWGIAPALWFLALRGFMSAVNRPEPTLWITLAAIPVNALLVYL